jgi:hypothetical protein
VRFAGLERLADGRRGFSFDIGWTLPDIASPPAQLLALAGQCYEVERFELTSDPPH